MWNFVIVAVLVVAVGADDTCTYQPILSGITPLQSLGESNKAYLQDSQDCKAACAAFAGFTCTAFLWPAGGGDCYVYDKIDLTSNDIFREENNAYVLYVRVCGSDAIPSVGYCEFKENQTSITADTAIVSLSPGMAAEASCEQFCIAKYRGMDCIAYIVSPSLTWLSQCLLYADGTTFGTLASGASNLYVKDCQPPPVSCVYSDWGSWASCSSDCTQTRTRSVVTQASTGGAPCLDSEMTGSQACTGSACPASAISTPSSGSGSGGSGATTTITPIIPIGGGVVVQTTTTVASGSGSTTPCATSDWSAWSTCGADCTQSASRTVTQLLGCTTDGVALSTAQTCTGGSCPSGGQNPVTIPAAATTTSAANIAETGCRYDKFDPSSRPSTANFKDAGTQAWCANACAAETSFQCEAYATQGAYKDCYLFGAINAQTKTKLGSAWYLQDLNCVVNSTLATTLCGWQVTRNNISATVTASATSVSSTSEQWESLGYALNSDHCATLCLMNQAMFKPTRCSAFAFTYAVNYLGSTPNCYEYADVGNAWSLPANANGSYSLWQNVCPSTS
uniref:Apple domain-containing protein n=1 Tax=Panagrellus redivivus TaxID=6233 RepID=A0A7E4ZZX7_PANRE